MEFLDDIYDENYNNFYLEQNTLNFNEMRSRSNNSSLPLNSYSPFQSINIYSMINDDNNNQNIQEDSNEELIKIEKKLKDIENNNRFMLYLKMNDLLKNAHLLENDRDAIRKRNMFQNKLNKIMDTIKCKICAKTPKVFYICKTTKDLICQKCLENEQEKNKNIKFCNLCNQLIYSKEHFVELPVFNKILSYIDIIKGNNKKLFEDKIKDNIKKSIILCSEKIHEQNQKEERNDIFKNYLKEENSFDSSNPMKAVYFCMKCQRPFCSDCILSYKLKEKENIINDNIKEDDKNIINDEENINQKDNINDDKNQNKHNHKHTIFRIDIIKEFGIFDLLYEKQNTKGIISDLDSIDKKINDKIEYLNMNKQKMLSFIDYIKNIYIQKIDEIIDKLKSINKEKTDQVKIILEKSQELSNFLNLFKSKNDFKKINNKNSLKEFINIFESFHRIPYDIYKKINSLIKIKGTFNIKALNNFSFNICLKSDLKKEIPFNKKEQLKIIYKNQNKINNKILEIKEEEETKNNEEDKIKIKIKKKVKDEKIKEYYNCRFLINNNKNEFIEMKSKMKTIKFNKDDSFKNNSNDFISLEKDLNHEEIYEKNYLAEFNINSLKKLDDVVHNINLEIYDFKIY